MVFAQDAVEDEAPPVSLNPAVGKLEKGEPLTLHLYSEIFGKEKQLVASTSDRESVSRMIQGIFGRLFAIIFTLSGILMVVLLAVHGTRMIYAEFGGNVAVFSDAKSRVKGAAFGTAILLLSWVILNFIDPSLLRPKLFETITGLQEVGSGGNLISYDIKIPKGGVTFDETSDVLTISKCPYIKKGDFKDLVERVKESLGGQIQYSYQIVYARIGSSRAEFHNQDTIVCTSAGEKLDNPKKMTLQGVTTLVVFPVVSILTEETKKGADGNPKKENIVKKFWRGDPFKSTVKIDSNDCAFLGKAHVKTDSPVSVSQEDIGNGVLSARVNNAGHLAIINFPLVSFNGTADPDKVGRPTTGYHITKHAQYCTVPFVSGQGTWCTSGYEKADSLKEVQFEMSGESVGDRSVKVDAVGDREIFRITPVVKFEKGYGSCKDPLRGKTSCFEVIRDGNGDILNVLPFLSCLDEGISKKSAPSKKLLEQHAKDVITYGIEGPTKSGDSQSGDVGYEKFVNVVFKDFDFSGWDERAYGKFSLNTSGGRGPYPIMTYRITDNASGIPVVVRFRQNNTYASFYQITGWKNSVGGKTMSVYFPATTTFPFTFCVTPTIQANQDRSYELQSRCFTASE